MAEEVVLEKDSDKHLNSGIKTVDLFLPYRFCWVWFSF